MTPFRILLLSVTALLATALQGFGAAARPAVLFYGGVHNGYVTKPLVGAGIDVDVCPDGQLAKRLASRKYNVVVVGTMNAADRKAIDGFLAAGGGVLLCNPAAYPRTADWTATNEWLTALGARPRWEVLRDSDKDNVVRDLMGCALSFSSQTLPPVGKDVRGVLTLIWHGTTGGEPPMSFDLVSPDWKPVVLGAKSMASVASTRHDVELQKWMPKKMVDASPVLMAVRDVGKGRLAVVGIRGYWIFSPPGNCPTAEAMLSAGAGGKPSDWLRVFANAFRWLAEPSLKAGLGGAGTPDAVLNPPVQVWKAPRFYDWSRIGPMQNMPQFPGLIGARTALSSGSGTVADYVKAAKAAGLKFIVFLEDSLRMNQANWDKLVEQCTALSDDNFAAVPGLTYEDAQGDHLYAFADEVKFPQPSMLLPDGRLATIKPMRSRAYFDYVNEYMRQHIISGFWNHKHNFVHWADYKLYNSFPVYSFIDGKQVDDALDEYLYWQGFGGCQAVLAFEIMTSPDKVAERAKDGWRVISQWAPKRLRTQWHRGAYSFSGSSTQYITNGPRILYWESPNRLCSSNGQWWRPDIWEYRLRLRVASDVGLKSVTVHDGDRRVFRRWLPRGAKEFEQELVLSNCDQLGLTLIVEDVNGRHAVSKSFWNRNLIREEFMCSDRCNFLGNCRLRAPDGRQVWTQVGLKMNMGVTPSKGVLDMSVDPAVNLTLNSPTLPIDGRPAGLRTCTLQFYPQIPGELPNIFSFPTTYLVGPEIGIGQGNYTLAYDPAEKGATKTSLGHAYIQPQEGRGNAWGSWHHLVPTRKLSGWARTYAGNWIPGTFRIGWHETDVTLKDAVDLAGRDGVRVMYPSVGGWVFYRDGKVASSPEMTGGVKAFSRGTFAALEHSGGSMIVVPLEGDLEYHYHKGGIYDLICRGGALKEGDRLHYKVGFAGASGGTTMAQLLDFARKFGVAQPGSVGYAPQFVRGSQIDNYLIWRLAAGDGSVDVKVPRADLPGFLPAVVEGLNSHWSVQLLDRARKGPNTRALPIRDGKAYAMLDLTQGDSDLFIGHPVIADNAEVRILVSWMDKGKWFVEAHNPTDRPLKATLKSSPGWTPFSFAETIELAPGTSRTWTVAETARK